jgi:hypothetical protein
MELSKIENVVFGGIDMSDYPKFCDAYIESADYNGQPATEAELEDMMEDGEIFYNLLHDYIH